MITQLTTAILVALNQGAARPEITFRGLGGFDGQLFESRAYAVSGDGKIVVGSSNAKFGEEGFVWTEKDGMKSIGVLGIGAHISRATAISCDGTVVVGYSFKEKIKTAVAWTKNRGLFSLGLAPGMTGSSATGVSNEGKVIVGSAGVDMPAAGATINEFSYNLRREIKRIRTTSLSLEPIKELGFLAGLGVDPIAYRPQLPLIEVGIVWDSFGKMATGFDPLGGTTTQCIVDYGTGPGSMQRATLNCLSGNVGCSGLAGASLICVSKNGGVICGWQTTQAAREYSRTSSDVHDCFYQIGDEINSVGFEITAISADGTTIIGRIGKWQIVYRIGATPFLVGDQPEPEVVEAREQSVGKGGVEDDVQDGYKRMPKIPRSVSGAGTIVVGDIGKETALLWPYMWTKESGYFKLEDYLRAHCPDDMKGWILGSVRGISEDGRTVVGYGRDPKGRTEAFIATIGDVRHPLSKLFPVKKQQDDDSDGD